MVLLNSRPPQQETPQSVIKDRVDGTALPEVCAWAGHRGCRHLPYRGFQANVIKSHMQPKRKWTWLDMDKASEASGVERTLIICVLGKLEGEGKIRLKLSKLRSRFRVEAVPHDLEELSLEVFRRIDEREEAEVARVWDVAGLVSARRCQTGLLLERFGGPGETLEHCGHCEWCLHGDGEGQMQGPDSWEAEVAGGGAEGGAIDLDKWGAIEAAVDLPRCCARLLARFACGMSSPHIFAKGLSKHELYGSMADHDFKAVLRACQEICEAGGDDSGARSRLTQQEVVRGGRKRSSAGELLLEALHPSL